MNSMSTTTRANSDKETRALDEKNRCVIIGWNAIARSSLDKINRKGQLHVVGFVHIEPLPTEVRSYKSVPILGEAKELGELKKKHRFVQAIIALDLHDYKQIHEVIQLCQKYGIQYNLVSDLYDIIYGHTIEQVFKEIARPPEISIRRFFDLTLSFIGLVVFSPIWLLIAIAIKLDSPGTVLYSQERVGKEGKIFRIFKFRTMVQDAEKLSGPVLANRQDPRITRMGRFLRKTRMDEIPQLLNVFIGQMSIIGPRPERPYFVEKYRREVPLYKNRLQMKPGITGLAQVTVGYDEDIDDVRNKIKHDLYYLEHSSSVWLNLKILLKTIWVIASGQGQ